MTRVLKKSRRIGRNPKTGADQPISLRRVIAFKPSTILRRRINGNSHVASRK
jgi:integration host factor subunit alpha